MVVEHISGTEVDCIEGRVHYNGTPDGGSCCRTYSRREIPHLSSGYGVQSVDLPDFAYNLHVLPGHSNIHEAVVDDRRRPDRCSFLNAGMNVVSPDNVSVGLI